MLQFKLYQQSQMVFCWEDSLAFYVYFFRYLNNNRYFIVCSVYKNLILLYSDLHALINFSQFTCLLLEHGLLKEFEGRKEADYYNLE